MRKDIQEPTLYFKSTIDQIPAQSCFILDLCVLKYLVQSLTFSQFRRHFVSELLIQIFHVLIKSAIKFSQVHIMLRHHIFNSVRYRRFGFRANFLRLTLVIGT